MNILITGKNGYLSNSIRDYFQSKYKISVELQSVRGNVQEEIFENIETVVHTAAIVHKNEKTNDFKFYTKYNNDLTIELAKKAKNNRVKHFIFISSMAVYGNNNTYINKETIPMPNTYYGKSKLIAEKNLLNLESDEFKITIIRPPMIYGPGSPGNYQILRRISLVQPLIPEVKNYRSMLYITNFCELIYQVIKYKDNGIIHPQNAEKVQTSEMMRLIRKSNNKSTVNSVLLGNILVFLFSKFKLFRKAFNNLSYNEELSTYRDNSYQVYNFRDSIELTER